MTCNEIPHFSCFKLMLWILLSKRAWPSLQADCININACSAYQSETHLFITHQNQCMMCQDNRENFFPSKVNFWCISWISMGWDYLKNLHASNITKKMWKSACPHSRALFRFLGPQRHSARVRSMTRCSHLLIDCYDICMQFFVINAVYLM